MTNEEYNKAKQECYEEYECPRHSTNPAKDAFDFAFDRAYALGAANFQQESDAKWEKHMAQTFKTLKEAKKELGVSEDDITDAADWIKDITNDVVQGIIKLDTISSVIKLTKAASYASDKGTTCTPVEDVPSAKSNVPSSRTKQRLKFNIGDKVRIINDWHHEQKYKEEVTEIVAIDNSDPLYPYKVDIYDEGFGGLWYAESHLEPYESTENPIPSNLGELESQHPDNKENTKSVNLSQNVVDCDKQFDNILTDGFREHNRLHVATQILAGMVHSWWNEPMTLLSSLDESCRDLVEITLKLTDMLLAECEKGGKP